MKIKVFVLNKNNKIELTEKELKELLDDAYNEGRKSHVFCWEPPTITTPYYTTADNITLTNGTTAAVISKDADYGIGNNS